MPKSNFVNGTVVSPDFLNALQDIQFDGQNLDGHYPQIVDSYLSDAPSSLKTRSNSFLNSLLVTQGTGLSVNYNSGSVRLTDGSISPIAAGAVVVANNATNCVFVNESGAVQIAGSFLSRCLRLASVVTVSGAITAISDLRPRYQIQPIWNLVKFLGGSGDEGDLVVSGNLTLDKGVYFYKSITVNAGATLTIDKSVMLHVSGNVEISGTITVTTASPGGSGGTGTLVYNGTTNSGSGIGGVSAIPLTYNHFLSPIGSGGASGNANAANITTTGLIGSGGYGGGAFMCECGGTFRLINNGAISARGGNASAGIINSGGSGIISGSGGGSGGLVLIKAGTGIVIASTATVDVRGGNGSAAVTLGGFAQPAYGGGGGGGGRVVCQAPSITFNGAALLSSGSKGADIGTPTPATGLGSGSGGSFGGRGGVYNGDGEFAGTSGLLISNTIYPVG